MNRNQIKLLSKHTLNLDKHHEYLFELCHNMLQRFDFLLQRGSLL